MVGVSGTSWIDRLRKKDIKKVCKANGIDFTDD